MKEDDLQFEQMRVFLALLAERSLTRAAQRLEVSQPTVSKTLKRLRDYFGDPLFVRVAGGMEPTVRARDLEEPVRALVEDAARLRSSHGAFDPARSTRSFSIFISDVGAIGILPAVAERIGRTAPGVRLRAIQLDIRTLHRRLESGDADLAVGDLRSLVHNIRRQQLLSEGYLGLVRKGHPRLTGTPTADAYAAERHVLVSAADTGHGHRQAERALEAALPAANIALRVPGFVAAAMIARRSDLVATLPARIAATLAGELDLVAFAPPLTLPEIVVSQHWHERFDRDAGNRWLRETIFALFGRGRAPVPEPVA